MKRNIYGIDELLREVGRIIGTGVLVYFECHKELLSDKNYNCAYKIAKRGYIKGRFGSVAINKISKYYEEDIEYLTKKLTKNEVEDYKREAEYLVDIVKRYDIASRYDDAWCN